MWHNASHSALTLEGGTGAILYTTEEGEMNGCTIGEIAKQAMTGIRMAIVGGMVIDATDTVTRLTPPIGPIRSD